MSIRENVCPPESVICRVINDLNEAHVAVHRLHAVQNIRAGFIFKNAANAQLNSRAAAPRGIRGMFRHCQQRVRALHCSDRRVVLGLFCRIRGARPGILRPICHIHPRVVDEPTFWEPVGHSKGIIGVDVA